MKLLVINGPNLNLLGTREPDIYGSESYAALVETIRKAAAAAGVRVKTVQSNHEGSHRGHHSEGEHTGTTGS